MRHNERRDRAKRSLASRRLRHRHFGENVLNNHVWDLLLVLYIADDGENVYNIAQVTELSGVKPTTALRRLGLLETEGLVIRDGDPGDGRVTLVRLSENGRQKLDDFFQQLIGQEQADLRQ